MQLILSENGHCEINREQAEKSCFSFNDYNLKDSLDLMLNNIYYLKFREVLKQLVNNDLNYLEDKNKLSKSLRQMHEIEDNRENASKELKSTNDKRLIQVNRKSDVINNNLSVINDEM